MERVVTVVSIGLIQIVAALNILIALVMMVMEKHRDIAILMSMGARARSRNSLVLHRRRPKSQEYVQRHRIAPVHGIECNRF